MPSIFETLELSKIQANDEIVNQIINFDITNLKYHKHWFGLFSNTLYTEFNVQFHHLFDNKYCTDELTTLFKKKHKDFISINLSVINCHQDGITVRLYF